MDGTAAELARLMRAMGFTPTSGQIYARLVFGGSAPHEELRQSADRELFADAVRELAVRRLVAEGRDRQGPRMYAVDPGVSLTSLVAELVWSRMTDLAPIDDLPETDDRRVEAVRRVAARALDICHGVWQPEDGIRGHRSTRASSAKELSVLAAEAVLLARTAVRSVSRHPRLPDVAFFWKAITSRMSSGVTYQRVTDLHELVEHGLRIVERDMSETGVDLRVLERSRLSNGFSVIDRRYAVVYNPPQGSVPPAGGTLTADKRQVERKRKLFDRLYEDAIPGDFVAARLRERAAHLLDRAGEVLPPDGTTWLADIIEFGKFSTTPVEMSVVTTARRLGLVERNYTEHLIPVYGLKEVELRRAWDSRT